MKTLNILILGLITILISSCLNSKEKEEHTGINETPDVFQDHTIIEDVSSFSKRGYYSLTDKLYKELIEKDDDLKKLEDKIKTLTEENYKGNINTDKFLSDNENYYNEIFNYASSIQDSLLRMKVISKINSSEEYYKKKIENLINTKEDLNKKIAELNDYRTALKIVLTEKSIKSYQDNFKQDTISLKELIKKYESTVKSIENKIEK